jgi:methyl-accepting chemotaxis protein
VEKVSGGRDIADSTRGSLTRVHEITGETSSVMSRISAVSRGQHAFITEMNQSVDEISAVIAAHSATAEECSAQAQELSSQAQLMHSSVSRFRLRKNREELL